MDAGFPNRVDRLAIPSRRLRTIQGILLWSRRVAVLARSTDAEFIWCGNIKPAAYPAKWTMERTGTPFGILLHGGDLLILQHQIHQSAMKRKTAAALLVVGRGARRQQRVDPRSLSHLARASSRSTRRPTGCAWCRSAPIRRSSGPGIDTREVRERYGLDDGRWLLSVARLTRHKGIDTALQALARLAAALSRPPLRGGRHGRGAGGARGRGARARRGATGCASSPMSPTAICRPSTTAAEIYLGVSRLMEQRVEGFGISLAEASACGVPVIAGRSGGIPAAVRDGETGLLVDAERVEAVAQTRRTAAGRRRAPGRAWARPGAGRSRATTTGIASPPTSCASAASSAPPPSRRPADALGAHLSRPSKSTTASTGSGSERQGPRALDLDWRLTHLLWRHRALLRRYSPEGKRVLDFGCMDGIFTLKLQQLGGEAVGYDISPAAIAQAKRFRGPAARPVFTTVPPGPGQFDRIYCQEVLEHVEDDSGLIGELVGYLAPGGSVVGTTPVGATSGIRTTSGRTTRRC